MKHGPLSESPSRIQKALLAGPPIVQTLACAVGTGVVMALFAFARGGFRRWHLLLVLGAAVAAGLLYEVFRVDKHATHEEKLARVVVYPTLDVPRLRNRTQRRLAAVILVLMVAATAGRLVTLVTGPAHARGCLELASGAFTVLVVAGMLRRPRDEPAAARPHEDAA
ncbi:MAG TPA: hypothetical protein VIL48_06555 [Acidimicrobiales bacterium]